MRIIENGKSQIWSEYKISIQQSIIGTWNIVPYNFVAFKSVVNTFIELNLNVLEYIQQHLPPELKHRFRVSFNITTC